MCRRSLETNYTDFVCKTLQLIQDFVNIIILCRIKNNLSNVIGRWRILCLAAGVVRVYVSVVDWAHWIGPLTLGNIVDWGGGMESASPLGTVSKL